VETLKDTEHKAVIKLCKTEEDYPANTVGTIRLWIEGNPPTPTDLHIFIGDYIVSSKEAVMSKDFFVLDDRIKKILDYSKVKLSDYGQDKRRSFHMDIKAPKELIDGYTK